MQMMQSLMKSRAVADRCWCVCIDLNTQTITHPQDCADHSYYRSTAHAHALPPGSTFFVRFLQSTRTGFYFSSAVKKETSWDPNPVCASLVQSFSACYGASTMESVISVFIRQIFTLKFKFPMLQIQLSLWVLKPASIHTSQCANNLTYGSSVWKIKDIIIDEPVYLFTPHSFDL